MTVTMTSDITVTPIRHLAEDRFVAEAARVSTLAEAAAIAAEERDNGPLIRRLMSGRHGSPFEHNFFNFRVHAPLNVFTEHLRHRIGWNYNGESGRFTEFSPVFYMPPPERGVTQVGRAIEYNVLTGSEQQRSDVEYEIEAASGDAWARYEFLIGQGIAREVARTVLPNNLMTTYYTSCNARSLMHFLGLRGEGTHALWEIQQVAKGYELAFAEAMPLTYAAFVENGRVSP